MSQFHQYVLIVVKILYHTSFVNANDEEDLTFPPDLLIGVATSAYQIEGAWNISDRGENIWDRYVHSQPHKVIDGTNADVAADSYHKYKEDVQLLRILGVNFYRFSISWTRILPTGHANVVSQDGVRYYNNLIDELIKYNISPVATIYHFDLPQVFQDLGGWTNEIIVDLFGDYARVTFREFGDRVKIFSTINEPDIMCEFSYSEDYIAPGFKGGKYAKYLCAHNVVKAHARAYHIYDEEFRCKQNGKIGIVINLISPIAKNTNDETLADIQFQFKFGLYAHPIFSKNGDYPDIVKQRVAENSKFEGLQRSRLPSLTQEWINYILGTADYLGLNYYSSTYVKEKPKSNYTIYDNDCGCIDSFDETWAATTHPFIRVYPQGILYALNKVKNEYDNPIVYITENGLPDSGQLEDYERMEFIYNCMKYMIQAIKKYKCNVQAYTVWSVIDNFEWSLGYSARFGLFSVDITDPNRKRIPKASAIWFRNVIAARKLLPIPEKNQRNKTHSRWRLSWLGAK